MLSDSFHSNIPLPTLTLNLILTLTLSLPLSARTFGETPFLLFFLTLDLNGEVLIFLKKKRLRGV